MPDPKLMLNVPLDRPLCAAIINASEFDGIDPSVWAERAIRAYLKRRQPVT